MSAVSNLSPVKKLKKINKKNLKQIDQYFYLIRHSQDDTTTAALTSIGAEQTQNIRLPFPFFKRFRLPIADARAYIILHNVRVTQIAPHELGDGWYQVEDDTGLSVMNWSGHELLSKLQSPIEAAHAEGFEDGDFVYEIFCQYLIEYNLPNILTITKHPRARLPMTAVERLQAVAPFLLPFPG